MPRRAEKTTRPAKLPHGINSLPGKAALLRISPRKPLPRDRQNKRDFSGAPSARAYKLDQQNVFIRGGYFERAGGCRGGGAARQRRKFLRRASALARRVSAAQARVQRVKGESLACQLTHGAIVEWPPERRAIFASSPAAENVPRPLEKHISSQGWGQLMWLRAGGSEEMSRGVRYYITLAFIGFRFLIEGCFRRKVAGAKMHIVVI